MNVSLKNVIKSATLGMMVAGVLSMAVCTAAVKAPRKEFTSTDYRVGFFKGFGKPWLVEYDSAINKLSTIVCGWYDEQAREVKQFKTGKDLEFVIPIRETVKYADTNVQTDVLFDGWREACIAKMMESFLHFSLILPEKQYEGTLLVDEYKNGVPMKWVFKDLEGFRGIKAYLTRMFAQQNVVALQEKPLLLVQFEQNNQVFDNDDLAFLSQYYELLDPTDPVVKVFFNDAQQAMERTREATKDAKTILKSGGELFFEAVEDAACGFKAKDITAKATSTVVTLVTVYLAVEIAKKLIAANITNKVEHQAFDLAARAGLAVPSR